MEHASTDFDFASYVIPAWLRTRASLSDDVIEVRCPLMWGPIPTSRILYRFGLSRITGVRTEQTFDRVSAIAAAAAVVLGLVAVVATVRSGALLTGVVAGVVAVLIAGLAVIVGARTRIWMEIDGSDRVWFDVAATEHHRASQFVDRLLHDVRRSSVRGVPEDA
jgi:hypothetical protein